MKRRFYWIYYITLIILFSSLVITINEVSKLKTKVNDLEAMVYNHEYRLEDIMPNDDIPH